MINLPIVQIRQQHARLHIDADLGRFQIRQPKPELNIQVVKGSYELETPKGDLRIDTGRARDALLVGNHLEFMHRIYTEAFQVGLEGIGRIVEEGNRMADIPRNFDAIPEIAFDNAFMDFKMVNEPPAAYDNVDIDYTANPAKIRIEPNRVQIEAALHRPEIEYIRGKMEIYMDRMNSIRFEPPQLDIQV